MPLWRVDVQLHGLLPAVLGSRRLARMAQMMASQTLLRLVPVEESQAALRRRPADQLPADIVRREIESAQRAIREHYAWSRERLVDTALGVWLEKASSKVQVQVTATRGDEAIGDK